MAPIRHIHGEMNAPEVSAEFRSQLNTTIRKYVRTIIRNHINVILNAYALLYLQILVNERSPEESKSPILRLPVQIGAEVGG
jgi:hypothetical protein